MYSYSYKVNKRRLLRKTKRQFLRHLIDPHDSSSDDNPIDENNEQAHLETKSSKLPDNNHVSLSSCTVNMEEDNWISDDEYEDDKRPIYVGSSMTLSTALRLINDFYLNNNLDKQTINNLLKLIRSLLPKGNLLPSTWKSMNKLLHYTPSTSTTFLCGDCYESCQTSGLAKKSCLNPHSKAFSQHKVIETVEIVRFDVRTQIQSIMARNIAILNQSQLFPPSDICFAEQYQHTKHNNNNRITLIVHSDGAPLVRSSKKCIWPCFASISELPPPLREFQSNIIILAIWTSRKKPNVNIFLEQTINDLIILIQNGTTIFIGDHEYKIEIATQFFISDLPAKALFCCTTNFNGYFACTYCHSKGKIST
jgi:tnp2 family transposase